MNIRRTVSHNDLYWITAQRSFVIDHESRVKSYVVRRASCTPYTVRYTKRTANILGISLHCTYVRLFIHHEVAVWWVYCGCRNYVLCAVVSARCDARTTWCLEYVVPGRCNSYTMWYLDFVVPGRYVAWTILRLNAVVPGRHVFWAIWCLDAAYVYPNTFTSLTVIPIRWRTTWVAILVESIMPSMVELATFTV